MGEKLDEVLRHVVSFDARLVDITNRLEALEVRSAPDQDNFIPAPQESQPAGSFQETLVTHSSQRSGSGIPPLGGAPLPTGGGASAAGIDDSATSSDSIQREYEILKNSLTRVRLPSELTVFDSKQGISKNCQTAVGVVSKCARYAECALKQLAVIQTKGTRNIEPEDFEALVSIHRAQIDFLQSKYTSLLIKSNFDENTHKFYEFLDKSNSALSGVQQ